MRQHPPTTSITADAVWSTRRTSGPSTSRMVAAAAALLSMVALFATLLPATPADAQGSNDVIFEGAGWGHGVGMSQNGARNMASQGRDHVAILNHYYPNTIISEVPPLDVIRVHIGDAPSVGMNSSAAIVFERNGVPIVGSPDGAIKVTAQNGGLQIGDVWTSADGIDPVIVSFTQPIKLQNNGHSYLWGKLQLSNHKGKVRVVEALALEDYVKGISEMPAAWPLEALMAQAIAARTYAHEVTLHRRNSPQWAQAYDISATTVDQNYIGWDAQDGTWDQKWVAAAQATAGVEIVDSNGPIRAYYSASNGGWTETAAYVFAFDVPYTVSGPDPYDAGGHPWTTWTRRYSKQSLSRWLNANDATAVGQLQSISMLGGAGASARLDRAVVELVGSNGTRRITGKQLMLAINAGVFGEGGGLSTHLPGTLMTIGDGASAGPPRASGQSPLPAVTPDPVVNGSTGYVPPEGWVPVPGTGVPPTSSAAPDNAPANTAAPEQPTAPAPTVEATVEAAPNQAAPNQAAPAPATDYTPPPDWTPEPGTGVPPAQPATPNPSADGETLGTGGGVDSLDAILEAAAKWQPEPGTGIPPGTDPAMVAILRAAAEWRPENGTGIPAGTDPAMAAILRAAAEWRPEAGTGIPAGTDPAMAGILAAAAGWTPEPGTGVAPTHTTSASGTVSLASAVTSSATSGVRGDGQFAVVAPQTASTQQARDRLHQLSVGSQIGSVDGVDLSDVDGVCTMQHGEVTCLPIASYYFIVDND